MGVELRVLDVYGHICWLCATEEIVPKLYYQDFKKGWEFLVGMSRLAGYKS